jgi:hypothetical protein
MKNKLESVQNRICSHTLNCKYTEIELITGLLHLAKIRSGESVAMLELS